MQNRFPRLYIRRTNYNINVVVVIIGIRFIVVVVVIIRFIVVVVPWLVIAITGIGTVRSCRRVLVNIVVDCVGPLFGHTAGFVGPVTNVQRRIVVQTAGTVEWNGNAVVTLVELGAVVRVWFLEKASVVAVDVG